MYPQTWYPQLDFPGSNFTIEDWGLIWITLHANGLNSFPVLFGEDEMLIMGWVEASHKAGKPVVLEEFGVSGLGTLPPVHVGQVC